MKLLLTGLLIATLLIGQGCSQVKLVDRKGAEHEFQPVIQRYEKICGEVTGRDSTGVQPSGCPSCVW
jgi:hypothetical protein